MIMEKEKSYAI